MDIYGFDYFPNYYSRLEQEDLLNDIRHIVKEAPLITPIMPKTGKEMSVRQTNCGELGWVTDKEQGYRYQKNHPITGKAWPDIPPSLQNLWQKLSGFPQPAEACLINFYALQARTGMHRDKDKMKLNAPVISISLGDSCLFRIETSEK